MGSPISCSQTNSSYSVEKSQHLIVCARAIVLLCAHFGGFVRKLKPEELILQSFQPTGSSTSPFVPQKKKRLLILSLSLPSSWWALYFDWRNMESLCLRSRGGKWGNKAAQFRVNLVLWFGNKTAVIIRFRCFCSKTLTHQLPICYGQL